MSLLAGPSNVSTAHLRALVWQGTVPLSVGLDSGELPAGADRTTEAYYVDAPRLGYLPMLLDKIKQTFLSLLLDETSYLSLDDANLWLEHLPSQTALRWHWPIGLIYDTLVASSPSTTAATAGIPLPLALTLHISPPPIDRLLLPNSIQSCREAFMSQTKEADFVRFGSTRRVTNLRQREAESLWEGLVELDFDKFWTVANKLIPPAPSSSSNPSPAPSPNPASPQPSTLTGDRMPDANGVRAVPMRVYLPFGAQTLQSNMSPLSTTSEPTTLGSALSAVAPLLFPPTAARRSEMGRLASAWVQGVNVSLDAEIGWLGSVLCGADGWLSVVVRVVVA